MVIAHVLFYSHRPVPPCLRDKWGRKALCLRKQAQRQVPVANRKGTGAYRLRARIKEANDPNLALQVRPANVVL